MQNLSIIHNAIDIVILCFLPLFLVHGLCFLVCCWPLWMSNMGEGMRGCNPWPEGVAC